MTLSSIFHLPFLVSVELLVLIASLFLMVYIAKQQLSKWYSYGSAAIIIFTLIMIICTCCAALCMRHCGNNRMNRECDMQKGMHGEYGMEEGMRMHKMMMMQRMNECCGEEKMECCKMMKDECKKEEKKNAVNVMKKKNIAK